MAKLLWLQTGNVIPLPVSRLPFSSWKRATVSNLWSDLGPAQASLPLTVSLGHSSSSSSFSFSSSSSSSSETPSSFAIQPNAAPTHARPFGFFSYLPRYIHPPPACASFPPPFILQASAAVHVADPLFHRTRPLMLAASTTAMQRY
ncbi:hypothetical protein LX36DRAFT_102627 [Colletotrichum falcatum]|nr:hypothetical protein LX36DRAFT_102627 [Colletotrichum falcatum]